MAHNSSPQSPSVWYKLVHMEPALWRAFIVAVFSLLASVGVVVSDDIPNNLVGVIIALASIIQWLWTRQAVVPEAKVVVWKDSNNNLRAGEAVPTGQPTANLQALEEAAYLKGKVR